jgi:NADPH-dependent ferric siderophore reductase
MMTVTAATDALPMIIAEVEAVAVRRLSPTYVRVELGGPALADFGVDGPLYDQRIKLVFPPDSGRLPSLAGADASWLGSWLDLPTQERGHMRTYTVRDVLGAGVDTRLVVDFVLHLAEGATGPGSSWAAQAAPGDRLVLLAPRKGEPFGGIEFVPGDARVLLLVADETAVPAVGSILEDLPPSAVGTAFLEVPDPGDVQDLDHPVGVEVVWLPRGDAPLGSRVSAAVLAHLGRGAPDPTSVPGSSEDVDPDLWETPHYSSSGEDLTGPAAAAETPFAGLYAWIAGESGVVTALRRALVKELGMDRRQVSFMGYWRRGVAMRS